MAVEVQFLNRRVILLELKQSLTYEGLLAGLPTRERNQERIEYLFEQEFDPQSEVAPYLVPPEQKPIKNTRYGPYPFGTPSSLPGVLCVARFRSSRPVNGEEADASSLKVIWFQDTFALPIAADVLAHIAQVDWNKYAGNWVY